MCGSGFKIVKTSVVIAVFNHSEILRKSLLCASGQADYIDEIVISDDGSSEDVLQVIKDAAPQLNCATTYVRQQDLGFRLARSKNNGIRHSTGDYLIFIDQDLIYTKGYIKTFIGHRRKRQFIVSYPIRLDEKTSVAITNDAIRKGRFDQYLSFNQKKVVYRQFIKDGWEHGLRTIVGNSKHKPKLRGGCFAANREDLLSVNGFDENFIGWGNEDDDLGRRFYCSGIIGKNYFWNEFPLHLYHPEYHQGGERNNHAYSAERIEAAKYGDLRAVYGVENTLGDDTVEVIKIQ